MGTLYVLLLGFSIAGYLNWLSAYPGIGLYKAPFIFCCIASLTLYAFAILGQLETGLWCTAVLGLSLFFLRLSRLFKGKISQPLAGGSITLSAQRSVVDKLALLVLTIPFVTLYIAIDSNFKFLLWDEFSYWASSAKIIYETNALFKNDSPIFFKSYPPLQQLFQYYFVKLSFWSEKNVLFAQIFWSLSAILCVTGSFVKKPVHTAIVFLTSCSFLYLFDYSYSTIYSDPLLGVCFAACLALAIKQDGSTTSVVLFFISGAVLLLLKEIAVLLVLVSLAVFIVGIAGCKRARALTARGRWFFCASRVLLVVLGLIAVLQSWSWYVSHIEGTRDLAVGSLKILFEPAMQARLEKTSLEFIARVLKPGYLHLAQHRSLLELSVVSLTGLLLSLSVALVYATNQTERLKFGWILLLIAGGAAGYTLGLLLSYALIFTEYEGIRLASFERYLSTYMLAWLLIVYSFLTAKFETWDGARGLVVQVLLAVAVSVGVTPAYYSDLYKIGSSGEGLKIRQDTEAFAASIKPHLKSDDKVYFVAQKSNGLERVMFYYAMLPFTTSTSWCWSIGPKYFEGDVWTCNSRLQELVKEFDYLALFYGDHQFWDQERTAFDAASQDKPFGLFKIQRTQGAVTGFSLVQ